MNLPVVLGRDHRALEGLLPALPRRPLWLLLLLQGEPQWLLLQGETQRRHYLRDRLIEDDHVEFVLRHEHDHFRRDGFDLHDAGWRLDRTTTVKTAVLPPFF